PLFSLPALELEATATPAGPAGDVGDRRARRVYEPLPDVALEFTVRVRFEILASGRATPELLDGTGNPASDEAILARLREWRWEPAFRGGRPVDSVEVFRLQLSAGTQ
ncbi:MAG: hypothetical protein AB1758_33390, partial [Candidatus Eremiobacterota bacterium]